MRELAPTVIIGAGISGLSPAYYLAQKGAPSIILDPRPRPGGVIETIRTGGFTIDAGPDSFLAAKPEAAHLDSRAWPRKRCHLLQRPSTQDLHPQTRPHGPNARRPHDGGSHQDHAHGALATARLAHQDPHGPRILSPPRTTNSPIAPSPNSSRTTTAPRPSTISPSRCYPASTAEIRATSAFGACFPDSPISPTATEASPAACSPTAPKQGGGALFQDAQGRPWSNGGCGRRRAQRQSRTAPGVRGNHPARSLAAFASAPTANGSKPPTSSSPAKPTTPPSAGWPPGRTAFGNRLQLIRRHGVRL